MPLDHGALTPGGQLRALVDTDPDVALDGFELAGRDDRADVRPRVACRPDDEVVDPLHQLGQEVVVDPSLDDETSARRANLAAVEEHAPQGPVRDVVEGRVVEHDRR